MSIELGATAPDFEADTTHGRIHLHEWGAGKWTVLFSHPRNFSAVCMTELSLVERMLPEFERRQARPLGLSIVPLAKHDEWLAEFPATQGCELHFPLVADHEGTVAQAYGMLHPLHAAGVTTRSLFIIDPALKIRFYAMYPTGVGRNFDEVLRVIDSLQLNARAGLVTPGGWRPGDDAVIPPSVNDEQAGSRFGSGIRRVTPYLRLVKPPE